MNRNRISIVGCLLTAMSLSSFATELNFQQGNLRKNGAGISGAYQTDVTFVRSGAPDTTNDSAAYAYMGTTSATDFRHLLMGFDLSYIETVANGGGYTIDSVELMLTKYNEFEGSGTSTFEVRLTDPFSETNATWNTSGSPGDELSHFDLDTKAAKGTVYTFTGPNWITAVSNALNDASNTLYVRGKRTHEGGGGSYYVILQSDEGAAHGIDGRPKLVVNVTYDTPPPTSQADIIDWSISNDVMRLVINSPEHAYFYFPLSTPDLMTGTWTNVPHSTNGLAPFMSTNLSFSTPEGINEVIYVKVDDSMEFFGIGSE